MATSKRRAAGVARKEQKAQAKRNQVAAAATAAEVRAAGGAFKVRATQTGFYNNQRYRENDVFTIASPADFSEKWMVRVSARTEERTTTGQEVLDAGHGDSRRGTGGANPLGAE